MEKVNVIGRTLILFVSDPWEFGTDHGCGPFESVVVGQSEHVLLLKPNAPFTYSGEMWEFLAATPRHADAGINALTQISKIEVNVIRVDADKAKLDPVSFGWSSYRGNQHMLIGTLALSP